MTSATPSSRDRHVLLAGGGSGGHVFPALAVGEALAARGWGVSFAGSARGLEARLVPSRGVAFHPLPSRPLVGRGLLARAVALVTLAASSLAGWRLVRRLGAAVALGTGGYASAPALLGARLAGRPVVLVEPNARPGVANRQLSRWARAAAVAYEDAGRDLACPAVVTGVPVRREFFTVPEPPRGGATRLLVLGGSQGAQALNRSLPAVLPELLERFGDLRVLHQTGAAHRASTRAAYGAVGLEVVDGPDCEVAETSARVELVPFVDDVAAALADSHLVLSRAGAIATAEIAAAGRAAILAPLALAGGHQRDNARAVEAAGAGRVVELGDGTGDDERAALAAVLADLLADPERLAAMGRAAGALARPGAAEAIADLVEAQLEGAAADGLADATGEGA